MSAPIVVRPSSIAGRGAFATRDLPPDVILGQYTGEALTRAQWRARYPADDGDYVLKVRRGRGPALYIDAGDEAVSNWTRFVNDPRGTRARPNVEFTAEGRVRTLRAIPAGAELLAAYGDAYWRSVDAAAG